MGVKFVERDYIVKMIYYMCCNFSMFLKKNVYMIYFVYMEKVMKIYIIDIDVREFKEFDDELDVDVVKVEKKDLIILF